MSFAPMEEKPKLGLPAARVGDADTHAGAITIGSLNVFVEGRPQARVGDAIGPCAAPIASGSPTVFINGLPAARLTDATSCVGTIVTGAIKTFIGNGKGKADSLRGCLKSAAKDGKATVAME